MRGELEVTLLQLRKPRMAINNVPKDNIRQLGGNNNSSEP